MEFFRFLTRRVDVIKGIGDKQATRLRDFFAKKAKMPGYQPTFQDLLFHLPFDFVDRRELTALGTAKEGIQTLQVRILKHLPPPSTRSNRPTPYKIQCEDDTGSLLLIFFKGDTRYLQQHLPIGSERIISGSLQRYDGMWQMTHPDIITPVEKAAEICRLDAIYPATEGISGKMFSRWIRSVLAQMPDSQEWISHSTLRAYGWHSASQSLKKLHLPEQLEDVKPARQRLAYDEAMAQQLAMLLLRKQQQRQSGVILPLLSSREIMEAIKQLPFRLTEGQRLVLEEISTDLLSGQRMLRLLQGDVGAGKTVVAALVMLAAVKAGYQAVLMAPTEILARQHLESLDSLLGLLDVPVIFLAGSLTVKQREEARGKLKAHPAAIIIGTHALFQEGVEFANLAMVVIDEQHRFGVAQRLALSEKGGITAPHMLLMTATPIPRSLAMTNYGDLDVSLLKQKPEGRLPIDTRTIGLKKIEELLAGIHRAVQAGEKIYWICPLVEESMAMDMHIRALQAAELRHASLQVLFPNRVGLMHGKMPMTEREAVMQSFLRGEVRILVATTVVEVGVNVPDATIMVIENAERFGLAQLHQLRGRVGRSDKPSRCILLYDEKCSATAKERLKTMRNTNDGFVIAESDLKLRGGGDILGTRQTGLPDFTFLDLEKDADMVSAARQEVMLVLEQDAELLSMRGSLLRGLLKMYQRDEAMKYLKSG